MSPKTKRSPKAVPARLADRWARRSKAMTNRPAVGGDDRLRWRPSPWPPGRIDGDAAIGRERDKALRKIDIAGCQRSADFALRHTSIETAVERLIADLDRDRRRAASWFRAAMPPRMNTSRDHAQRGRRRRTQRPDAAPTGEIAARPSSRALCPVPSEPLSNSRRYVGNLRLFHNKSRSAIPLLEITSAARYGARATSQAG